ncbi:hypothetical protein [Argonema galeatum]|uniref:hypothetical protein n=1 Tax=Argonema galeatum TaxID=2942762 RepID=UPI002010FAA7|nr:hypothetical protein [Argonema galeatum]MCL1467604.1 hypothetical protein [Argonema galeatum A003/A1]
MLVVMLQQHRSVKLEELAGQFPQKILFESRRKKLQRFLSLPHLTVEKIWWPLFSYWLTNNFEPTSVLYIAIDRTQWGLINLAAFLGSILLLIGTILGFLSGHIIGLIFWLSSGIKMGNISGITFAHLGGMIGLIFGSLFPSFPCIQHLALRIVFWSNGYIPWNYARFLNYCTERMILQRVGGCYRFIHRLLQEHFANMELVELSKKTNSN